LAHRSRFAGPAVLVAAVSLAFTPAQAEAATPHSAPVGTMGYSTSFLSHMGAGASDAFGASAYDTQADAAQWGWRRGWGGRRGWRRHRGIRGGDILAGAIVLGGIAAIASAASNNRRRDRDVVIVERDRVRDYDPRIDDRRYDDRRYDYRPENRRSSVRDTRGGSGIDNAVSMCLNEVERDVRVDSVDGASRVSQGWIVTGSLFDGSGFACEIDNSGRISNIEYGRGFGSGTVTGGPALAQAEGQWSDDRYEDARSRFGFGAPSEVGQEDAPELAIDPDDERLPAYPGGPLPGEEFPE
jgi:hypothetical protein